ncbi:MAG: hypothetical protein MH321_06355 [Leptospiraceae bacterium]|nr:hypothetical protein [Leptospiraceae bacterium]
MNFWFQDFPLPSLKFTTWKFLFISVLTLLSQQLLSQNIKVYGLSTCSHCIHFLDELKTLDEPYTFFDIAEDQGKIKEMRKYAEKFDPDLDSVDLPLVVYKNNIWIRPSFSEFATKLNFPNYYKNFSKQHKLILYGSSTSSEVEDLRMHFNLRKIQYIYKDSNLKETEEEIQKNILSNSTNKKFQDSLVYPILSIDGKFHIGANFLNTKKLFKK